MEETEVPKPVSRSNSTIKSDGKNDAATSAAASAAKGEVDETATESADVKDIMKLLVRDAKKAAALAVEPTVRPPPPDWENMLSTLLQCVSRAAAKAKAMIGVSGCDDASAGRMRRRARRDSHRAYE